MRRPCRAWRTRPGRAPQSSSGSACASSNLLPNDGVKIPERIMGPGSGPPVTGRSRTRDSRRGTQRAERRGKPERGWRKRRAGREALVQTRWPARGAGREQWLAELPRGVGGAAQRVADVAAFDVIDDVL